MKKVQITETVLRDANQSLMATRLPYSDFEAILPEMDKAGYYSVECWGGATFDSCLRYLGEDPWERLRNIRRLMPNTKLQMLLRGQNLLGYKHYHDDVVEKFVEAFAKGLLLPDGLSCLPAVLLPLGFGRSAVRLQEGKFHQVRRMMAFLGLPLCYLKRVCEGGLWLGDLAPGAVTELDMGRTEQLITSSCDFDEKKLLANCVRNSQRFGGNDEKL